MEPTIIVGVGIGVAAVAGAAYALYRKLTYERRLATEPAPEPVNPYGIPDLDLDLEAIQEAIEAAQAEADEAFKDRVVDVLVEVGLLEDLGEVEDE